VIAPDHDRGGKAVKLHRPIRFRHALTSDPFRLPDDPLDQRSGGDGRGGEGEACAKAFRRGLRGLLRPGVYRSEALAPRGVPADLFAEDDADGQVDRVLLCRPSAAELHADKADAVRVDPLYIAFPIRRDVHDDRGLRQEGDVVHGGGVAALRGDKAPKALEGRTVCDDAPQHGAGRVLIRPAVRGTGVKAGGPVRAIMELAGVTDVITKSLGTSNAMNIVKATAEGLKNMQNPEEVAERRGVSVDYIWGRKEKAANAEEAE